jgi:hypothetical protein
MHPDHLPDPLVLSEHLARALHELDEPDDELVPAPDPEEHREYLERVRETARELEEFKMPPHPQGFLPPELEDWYWKHTGDQFYAREAVSHLPDMVERFSRLRPILVGKLPDRRLAVYLREATRCFVYGFFQGSIALSRAALEAGLNRHVELKLGSLPQMELKETIEKAARFKLISGGTADMAQRVRKLANQVLHSKPASEALAFEALVAARGVLRELCGE